MNYVEFDYFDKKIIEINRMNLVTSIKYNPKSSLIFRIQIKSNSMSKNEYQKKINKTNLNKLELSFIKSE